MCVHYLLRKVLPPTEGVAEGFVRTHLELPVIEELVGDLQDGRVRPEEEGSSIRINGAARTYQTLR